MEREIWEALGLRAPHRGTKARILVVVILGRDRQTVLSEGIGLFHLCQRKDGTIRETTRRRPIELQKEGQAPIFDSNTKLESPSPWHYLVIYSRVRKVRTNSPNHDSTPRLSVIELTMHPTLPTKLRRSRHRSLELQLSQGRTQLAADWTRLLTAAKHVRA